MLGSGFGDSAAMTAEDHRVPASTEVSALDLQLSACAIEGPPEDGMQPPERRRNERRRAQPSLSTNTVRLAVGHLLGGRYRIERELGEGGMGVVYLAADEQVPGERFALKVLKEELRAENLSLLREEVRKTRKLSHPNIVDVHSVNVDGQQLYVLMEYLEGKSLDRLLDEEFGRGMPFSHAWPIIEDVAAALGNAHDHNVIHSDLKPANVFLTTSGRTKLLDFGIARVSRGPLLEAQSGPRALTPAYASCEMLQGKEADRRDDIYSFGCVIYEMLSGERPFGDIDALQAREAGTRVPQLAMLTKEQNAALAQALAFDRERRTSSVERLIEALGAGREPHRWRTALIGTGIVGALVAAALTYVVLDRLWSSRSVVVQAPPSSAREAAALNAAPFSPSPYSIAVLPLANESGEAGQQYFSDGISEDLITALSQFASLKVIGRTSAFVFRDSKEDSRSIGAKLGVAHLLEGSVRRSGQMVRVSAELIDTTDGSTQWSQRYDRPYKDLFALQDEITSAVAGALRAKLLPSEHADVPSDRPPGGSLEAYNAVLQARFYYFRRGEADFRKAIEYYTTATQLDPRYAVAWSGLARSWTALGGMYLEAAAAQEAYAKARQAVDRALALAPNLVAGHVARGYLLQVADLDWHGAEAEFRRAMALAPNDGETRFFFGQQLAVFGQVEPATELTRQALTSEPLQAGWYEALAFYLLDLKRHDEAERAVRRAIELEPAAMGYHVTLTMIEVQRGDATAALAAAQGESPGLWQDTALAFARQIGGDPRAANAARAEAETGAPTGKRSRAGSNP